MRETPNSGTTSGTAEPTSPVRNPVHARTRPVPSRSKGVVISDSVSVGAPRDRDCQEPEPAEIKQRRPAWAGELDLTPVGQTIATHLAALKEQAP